MELPPYYVPDAYREWGVILYDWQMQCSSTASEEGLSYTVRKLFPTVGCEADAIAFEEELVVGLRSAAERHWEDKTILRDGSYTMGPRELPTEAPMRLELCLGATHSTTASQEPPKRQRVRLVYSLGQAGGQWQVQQLHISRERFDRVQDGRRELAGCGGGLPAFASGPRAEREQVVARGWQAAQGAVYEVDEGGAFRLAGRQPQQGASWSCACGEPAVQLLPLGLWSSVSGQGGDLVVEAGILLEDAATRRVAGRRFAAGKLVTTWMGTDVLA